MMLFPHLVRMVLVFVVCCGVHGSLAAATYQCKGPENKSLKITFSSGETVVEEDAKWVLPYFKVFRDEPREPIRFYTTLSKNQPKVSIEKMFEIQEQMFSQEKPQSVQLAVLKKGELITRYRCSYGGAAVKVRLIEDPVGLIPADRLWVTRASKGFVDENTLSEESLQMFSQIVERYAYWNKTWDAPLMKRLVVGVFAPIGMVSPKAIPQLESRLSEEGRLVWKRIMEWTGYAQFSNLQRWMKWSDLIQRGNTEAFRAAVRGFMNSPLFSDVSTKSLLEKEMRKALKGTEPIIYQRLIKNHLTESEKSFIEKMWKERSF